MLNIKPSVWFWFGWALIRFTIVNCVGETAVNTIIVTYMPLVRFLELTGEAAPSSAHFWKWTFTRITLVKSQLPNQPYPWTTSCYEYLSALTTPTHPNSLTDSLYSPFWVEVCVWAGKTLHCAVKVYSRSNVGILWFTLFAFAFHLPEVLHLDMTMKGVQ